jgi:hypothetical protein
MAAENILGKLIIEGANQAASMAGGSPSLGSGLAGGGGSNGNAGSAAGEREARGIQKTIKDANVKALGFAKDQPKWWTKMFKTLGIQMGLAGVLKQSQVFTSTVGAFFQIFGAMVDVMLAPLIKPVLMPLMRWFARQIPTMGRLSRAFFGFVGSTIMKIIGVGIKIKDWTVKGYDWLKAKGEDIWNGIKNMGSATWWKDSVLQPMLDVIKAAPGKIISGITSLFSWDTWHDIFRNLWNATLGGKSIWKLDIPTWNGASPKKQAANSNAFDQANNEGSFNDTAFGTPRSDPTHTPDPTRGTASNPINWDAPYEKEDKKLTETISSAPAAMKEMFDDFGVVLKTSLLAVGVSTTAVAGLKIKNLITRGVGRVGNLGLAPGKVALGIVRGIAQQINPFSQEAFIGQVARGQSPKNALGAAMGEWKGNMLKDLGFGRTPVVPSIGGPDVPTVRPRGSGLFDPFGKEIPSSVNNADDMAGGSSSKLTKVKIKIFTFTSWVKDKLKGLKDILSVPGRAKALITETNTKASGILKLINELPASSATKVALRGSVNLVKNSLLRALPIIGAAVGVMETAYGVNKIFRSDMGWVIPKENTEAAMNTLGRMSGINDIRQAFGEEEHTKRSKWNPIGWAEGYMRSKGDIDMINAGTTTALAGYMNQTKAGNIFTQMALGTVSTGAGAFGLAGMPISAATSTAQMTALWGAMGDQNKEQEALSRELLDAYRQGVASTSSHLQIKIDGHDATMDVPW